MQDKRFQVVGVVTQADKPVGRGLKLTQNIIKKTALELGIPATAVQTPSFINPDKSLEGKVFYERLQEQKPDFFVVIAYGKLIPQALLDIPAFGAINVHGSLLPEYRGASPLQSVFLDQKKESGMTIMHMDAGMDTGAIVAKLSFLLPFQWTVKELIATLEKEGPAFLQNALRDYAKGALSAIPQDETKATHCQKILKSDGIIVPGADALASIYAKYRAYAIWPKIWFIYQDKTVSIERLVVDEQAFVEYQSLPLRDAGFKLNPAVQELFLKPEGKKAMDFQSFKNGYIK